MERVAGVYTAQGSDWTALINDTADRHGIPPRLLLATAIAECGLDETCEPGVTKGMARYGIWPDQSFGPCHQAVAWAPYGDQTNTPENIEACRQKFCGDLPYAFDVAAANLAEKWARYGPDGAEVLSRYNAPGLSLAQNPNRRNISYAWRISAQHVVTEEAPMPDWLADVRAEFPYVNGEYAERPLSAITGVTYHHGASLQPDPTYDAEMAMLQAYHRLHTETHGWPAIGYHLAVGSSGTVYYCNDLTLISWHAGPANAANVGIVLIGDFTHGLPPAVMIDAARRARGWVAQQVGVDDLPYQGHGDVMNTSCPGASWWPAHRDWLAGLPDDAAPEPEPPPEPEPVPDPWAEVARLNEELAACRSWSGATVEHKLRPAAHALHGLLSTRLTKAQRQTIERIRDELSAWAGEP